MLPNDTPTGDWAQDALETLHSGITALHAIMYPPVPTKSDLFPELVAICRVLTDHLSAYTVTAENFDEDAFMALEQAERLLQKARPLLGPQKKPRPAPGMLA